MEKDLEKPDEVDEIEDGRHLSVEHYKEELAKFYGVSPEEIMVDVKSERVLYKAGYDPKINGLKIPESIRKSGVAVLFGTTKFDPDTGILIEAGYRFIPKFEFSPIEMIGRRIERLSDIVKLIKTMRRPGHKKLRCFYVQDNFMVDHETTTSRTQDGRPIGFTRQGVEHIKERSIALGADSVYMVHYCPSENSAPPPIKGLAAFCRKKVREIKAHIIVYPESFGYISIGGIYCLRVLTDKPKKVNKSHRSLLPHDSCIEDPQGLLAWATALERRKYLSVSSMSERDAFKFGMDLSEIGRLWAYAM